MQIIMHTYAKMHLMNVCMNESPRIVRNVGSAMCTFLWWRETKSGVSTSFGYHSKSHRLCFRLFCLIFYTKITAAVRIKLVSHGTLQTHNKWTQRTIKTEFVVCGNTKLSHVKPPTSHYPCSSCSRIKSSNLFKNYLTQWLVMEEFLFWINFNWWSISA